jgi:glycosyltransferase involved in cell wall biosynthesis
LYEKFKQFNFHKDKLVQLYHGYDYTEIDAVKLKPNLFTERYIVFVGRLEKIKGAHTVLNAIKNCPDIQLKIIGDGTQKNTLQEFKQTNQLTNVSFLGKKNKQDTLQIINGADFLICASEWYEVLGFTVVEAMALGKPVIGSAIGAIPEMVINNKTGLLFEPGNYSQLSLLIKALYYNKDQIIQMGKNAQQHINNLINNQKHFDGLQKLIPTL